MEMCPTTQKKVLKESFCSGVTLTLSCVCMFFLFIFQQKRVTFVKLWLRGAWTVERAGLVGFCG